jgi:hypothetical protein
MMVTPNQIAQAIVGHMDGTWDDDMEAYVEAAAEGNVITVFTESDSPDGGGRILTGGFTITVLEAT